MKKTSAGTVHGSASDAFAVRQCFVAIVHVFLLGWFVCAGTSVKVSTPMLMGIHVHRLIPISFGREEEEIALEPCKLWSLDEIFLGCKWSQFQSWRRSSI